jgi:hypothetical protein
VKRVLVCLVVLFGCGKQEPDRWPEVERLAKPTVAAADGALLTKAIERVQGEVVPEMALEDVIAWRKAGGGLPWRDGRAIDDSRVFQVLKLGEALLERRANNTEAIETALYLAQRLRAEAPALIDIMIGFTLATKVTTQVPTGAAYAAFAPTEAEVLRAIPADAVNFMRTVDGLPDDDKTLARTYRRGFTELIVGAPTDRAGYVKHITAGAAKAEKSSVLSLVISSRMPTIAGEMFAAVETYRAWAR